MLKNIMVEHKESLSFEERDILREVGNICVGNSTGILSQLLGGVVQVNPPGLEILTIDQLPNYIKDKGTLVYGVNAHFSSQLQGTIFLLFPEKHSLKIIEKFLLYINTSGVEPIRYGISIIKEVGGIAIFSYINTLSSLIKKLILTSVPNFLSGTSDELITMILREYEHWGNICVVHTSFKEMGMGIDGDYYLIMDKASTDLILEYMQNPSL
ncbi:MAG: chemotaxis protein CheC [Candidatus Omnitrophota bacterium]